MHYTTVRAKIHRDSTGVATEIPVILTDSGPLQPLLEFLLDLRNSPPACGTGLSIIPYPCSRIQGHI